MIEVPLTDETLKKACGRIEDFYTVQQYSEWDDKVVAMTILRESLGIDDIVLTKFASWSEEFTGDDGYVAPMILGLIIGLIAADLS